MNKLKKRPLFKVLVITLSVFLFITVFVLIKFKVNPKDYFIIRGIAKELGCSGNIGYFKVRSEISQTIDYRDYLELVLDCPEACETFGTENIYRAASYRLYLKLSTREINKYEAIHVLTTVDNNKTPSSDKFFEMSDLSVVYEREQLVRKYLQALSENDTLTMYSIFDIDEFSYSKSKLDSINNEFYDLIEGKIKESRLYNFGEYNFEGKDYFVLIFLTDSERNYTTSFQITMQMKKSEIDNIVNITF